MSESDRERGLRIASQIRKSLTDTMEPMDSAFLHAVRRVGRAMRKKDAEDYLSAGADLAECLIAEMPLGRAERQELALLVLGELRPGPRTRARYPHDPEIVAVVESLRELQKQGCPRDAAVFEVARDIYPDLEISEQTVRDWERLVMGHEAEERAARAMQASLWGNHPVVVGRVQTFRSLMAQGLDRSAALQEAAGCCHVWMAPFCKH